jgi:hypothetical protein
LHGGDYYKKIIYETSTHKDRILVFANHKYASNVIEKCLV